MMLSRGPQKTKYSSLRGTFNLAMWNFQLSYPLEVAVIKESIAVPKGEIAAFGCGSEPFEDTDQNLALAPG